ncbi:MAG: ferritin-like domain-containing protein, partial [Deltaproteobacteria bacterium]|nr:ferritin-like domain-containing protein [Deltaproteobacteria bacterium]
LLNQARSAELGAISQYMIHHYELEDQDFGKLAAKIKEIAIVEMKHAEKLAERILFLHGEPTSNPDLSPKKGQEIPDILATNVALEAKAVKMYNEAVLVCAEERDQKSRQLFEELIADEEGHLNVFENFKGHVENLGQSYIATLIK